MGTGSEPLQMPNLRKSSAGSVPVPFFHAGLGIGGWGLGERQYPEPRIPEPPIPSFSEQSPFWWQLALTT